MKARQRSEPASMTNIKSSATETRKNIPNIYRYIPFIFFAFTPIVWRSLSSYIQSYSLHQTNQKHSSYYKKFSSTDEEKYVTCGSAIKLTHITTGYVLNSQRDANWSGRGSGQQVVTGNPDISSQQSLWLVREGHAMAKKGYQCATTTPVKCSSSIRLTHLLTNKNLHSHSAFTSQMSGANEITAYSPRGNGEGDISDDWIVECEKGFENWNRNTPVKLRHSVTASYLSASASFEFNERNCGRNCPIKNHIEAYGSPNEDKSTVWFATLGVHLSL